MSEEGSATAASAGALLRAARERAGMHIAVLSAAIKVPQRKLEALEADRYGELVDMTFTRALAQTVCRALKVDAAPVLALLPQSGPPTSHLEQVTTGLNAPFRDKPGRHEPSEWTLLSRPAFWGAVLVLLAALALYLMPAEWLAWRHGTGAGPEGAASVPLVIGSAAPATVTEPVAVVPSDATAPAPEAVSDAASAAASSPAPSGSTPAGLLALQASAQSWVEVIDGQERTLLSRIVQPGEALGLDGALPLRVKIGNAGGLRVSFRGQPVDLGPVTRDNVARLELK